MQPVTVTSPLNAECKKIKVVDFMIICGRTKDGKQLLLSEEEIVKNALEQEAQGIEPHFAWFNYKTKQTETPPGWLVWSLYDGGCGVVYKRHDGKMIIIKGTQGDFCYI